MMGYGWGMGWMWIIWLLVIVGVVLVAILLLRGGNTRMRGGDRDRRPGSAHHRTRAQEILDERYARGDLTEEEYQERLRVLGDETDR